MLHQWHSFSEDRLRTAGSQPADVRAIPERLAAVAEIRREQDQHLFALELGHMLPSRTSLLLAGEPRKRASADRLAHLVANGARLLAARQRDLYRYLREGSEFPGERLIACFNPLLQAERARKREDLLRATEEHLDRLVEATRRSKAGTRADLVVAVISHKYLQ